MNYLKCLYAPSLWLLVTNRLSWGVAAIFVIIALVEIVGQIAIKEKIFTKNIKIIMIVMVGVVLIGLASTAYLHYNATKTSSGINCV